VGQALWLYFRFNLSHRDIEDSLAERGIIVSREAVRLWCIKFGALYASRLKRKHRGYDDTFYMDEVFAGVPDHSDQRQAALPLAGRRPGEPAPRSALGMAKSLMCISKPGRMGLRLSASSGAYCAAMVESPER